MQLQLQHWRQEQRQRLQQWQERWQALQQQWQQELQQRVQQWQQEQPQQQQQQQLRSSSDSPKFFKECSAPQRQFSSSRQSSSPSSPKASTSTLNPFGPDSRSAGSSSGRPLGHFGKPPTPLSDLDERSLEAARPQDKLDEEDCAIRSQCDKLAKFAQRLFMCGICFEEMPNDSIARPDPCGHTFCRECLRGHVISRLDEHRFPILCPTCTASKGKRKGKKREVAGGTSYERTVNTNIISYYISLEVSQSLALDLGLTDKQYGIWTEMEMISFSVLLNCRKYVHGVRPPHASANIGIGANGRCSWLETITKKLRL